MENKNQNSRPRFVLEWVAFKDDPSAKPMFILKETEDLVDLQIAGTDQVMEAVQKTSLRPIEQFELNGLYGMANIRRQKKMEDGTLKELPPIDPRSGYVGAAVKCGHLVLISVKADGQMEAETSEGVPVSLSRSEFRILPKAVADQLKLKLAKRISEILITLPISEARWQWGSRGFTKKKKLADGKEIFDWPRVIRGELHIHGSAGPCAVISTKSGFDGEIWAKVRTLQLVEGKVELGLERDVPILERRKNQNGNGGFLFAHFKWMDEGFRAQIEKVPVVANLLSKLRPTNKK